MFSVLVWLPAVLHEAPAHLLLGDAELHPEVEPASHPASLGQTSGDDQLHSEEHPEDTEARGGEASGGEQGQVQQELPTSQEEENYPHTGKHRARTIIQNTRSSHSFSNIVWREYKYKSTIVLTKVQTITKNIFSLRCLNKSLTHLKINNNIHVYQTLSFP